jgi:hypothetical protein
LRDIFNNGDSFPWAFDKQVCRSMTLDGVIEKMHSFTDPGVTTSINFVDENLTINGKKTGFRSHVWLPQSYFIYSADELMVENVSKTKLQVTAPQPSDSKHVTMLQKLYEKDFHLLGFE